MSIAFDNCPSPPSRTEIEPVALDLIRRRGGEVMSTARRYASSPDDAEDAYQRALEILLTKAPSVDEEQLVPWLKTVVKHEAFALRKKHERDVPAEHDALDAFAADDLHAADERAERYDRLRVGAEALGRLKPQETTCLLLKAEGLSYQEIAAQTGWTYTKVNRCLTEGRRAFFARVEGIESGAECERMAPLLSALADGEASAEDMAALRPHLRACPSCRATLRDYRAAPRRVAALAGPLAAGGVFAWLGERIASAAVYVRGFFEAAAAQKAAVVAASTVAIAGGGAATIQAIGQPSEGPREQPAAMTQKREPRALSASPSPSPRAVRHAAVLAAPARQAVKAAPAYSAGAPTADRRSSRSAAPPPPRTDASPAAASAAAPAPAPNATSSAAPEPAPPAPDPAEGAGEFGP